MIASLIDILKQKTQLTTTAITNIVQLIEEGNTIPFIARYRKEMTGGASDSELREFEEVYLYQQKLAKRKEEILKLLEEKEVSTTELVAAIHKATTLSELEDIYRPFKDKKNTRATKAIARGLQPLADILLTCDISTQEFNTLAETFIKDTGDEKTSVASCEDAIDGAKDIVAEIVAEDPKLRAILKDDQSTTLRLQTKARKHLEEHSVYDIYKAYDKTLDTIPSYAYLAISRAEKEKQLRAKCIFNEARSLSQAKTIFIPQPATNLQEILVEALEDGIHRLLHPSLEREFRSQKKEQADREAIDVFGKNVQELLLGSPVMGKNILGFDPAFRTGCKLAVIDMQGSYLDSSVIYPTAPLNKVEEAEKILCGLINTYDIGLICIGNGTASRESEQFVATCIKKHGLDTKYIIVSEAGASVYSASVLANEEYPDLDVTIRGAINIAQRVQDPLATYVKIDPKSLGVGQYQHDVDQKLLKEQLEKKIEDTVNKVGIHINTASWTLLQHIAGLTNTTAKNIVAWKGENGSFTSRSQIKKVKGLGPKAFEQCAGFLRVENPKEPLDTTGIHPESYSITYTILEKETEISKKQLSLPYIFTSSKSISELASTYDIGEETLEDIIAELANPGLDPRTAFDESGYKSDVLQFEDVEIGMQLHGVVRNIVDFGVFVDIGLKNDALLHKSQCGKRVEHLFDVFSIGQQLDVYVDTIDTQRKRIGLRLSASKISLPTPPSPKKRILPQRKVTPKTQASSEYRMGGNISFS